MADCLYNGIELPAPPEWDQNTYPYAVIFLHSDGYPYFFSVHANPPLYKDKYHIPGGSTYYYKCVYAKNGINQTYKTVDGKWELHNAGTSYYMMAFSHTSESTDPGPTLIWTNTDVIRKDTGHSGEIYFAGSAPVPIPPTVSSLTPASMLAGWYTGKRMGLMHQGQ